MKTAITLPDEIFSSAEKLARRMGLSRSELFTTALRNFMEEHCEEHVTESLNAVYSNNDSKLDPSLQNLQTRTLSKKKLVN